MRLGLSQLAAVLVFASGASGQPAPVNPDARVLAEFRDRVDAYVTLARRVDDGAPKLEQTRDPQKIDAAQQARAERVRAARRSARPGDVFTPEVQRLFQRLMRPELKGPDAAETKGTLKEDAPADVPLKVNGDYPGTAPLSTMPPDLLARLPELPRPLEYRVIGKHLILLDTDANLVVDYIRNAVK